MTFWTFADAHPWPAVALVLIAACFVLALIGQLPRKPPPDGGR